MSASHVNGGTATATRAEIQPDPQTPRNATAEHPQG